MAAGVVHRQVRPNRVILAGRSRRAGTPVAEAITATMPAAVEILAAGATTAVAAVISAAEILAVAETSGVAISGAAEILAAVVISKSARHER